MGNYAAARADAEYYLDLLAKQEQSTEDASAGFEGRLLRAHLYMLEADLNEDGKITPEELIKARKRAVMDYDFVVDTFQPNVNVVRQFYPEAHYCIARLLPHAPDFKENPELAIEATERFQKAWQQDICEPLRHCIEVVVA